MKRSAVVYAFLAVMGTLWAAEITDPREGAGGIVAAPGFYILLGAPQGWIFESQTALEVVGAPVAIFTVESDLSNATRMIMANFISLGDLGFEEWLEVDAHGVRENFPGIAITDYPPVVTADSLSATVRGIEPGQSSYDFYERVAYIPYENYVVIVWLSAHSQDELKKSLPALDYVVSGVRILSEKELQEFKENQP